MCRKDTAAIECINKIRTKTKCQIYMYLFLLCYLLDLFSADVLELTRRVQKVDRVALNPEITLMGFLDIVVIAVLGSKSNGSFLGIKLELGGLHVVTRGSVSDQVVLPAVSTVNDVPVQSPGKGSYRVVC